MSRVFAGSLQTGGIIDRTADLDSCHGCGVVFAGSSKCVGGIDDGADLKPPAAYLQEVCKPVVSLRWGQISIAKKVTAAYLQEVCEPVTALGWGQISIVKNHGRVFAESSKCRGGTEVVADLNCKIVATVTNAKVRFMWNFSSETPFFRKSETPYLEFELHTPPRAKINAISGLRADWGSKWPAAYLQEVCNPATGPKVAGSEKFGRAAIWGGKRPRPRPRRNLLEIFGGRFDLFDGRETGGASKS